MVSVDEVTASSVRNKLTKDQSIREDGSKAVPTSVVEVIQLFKDIVETKRKNAKIVDRLDDLKKKLEDV